MTGDTSYKPLFSRFLSAAPERLHFAAHSHHYWPDVTYEAQQEYWQKSAELADDKWDIIFSEIIPAVQHQIARHLNLSKPQNIAFSPNTHEFIMRLLSCLPVRPKILTTDSEFYSFSRQISRLEEKSNILVEYIPVEPFASFPERFAHAARTGTYDLVFFSHVFFNSGYAVPGLTMLVDAVKDQDTLVVIDGYHGFMALPTDLSSIENRAFYMAGGYKYAMSGEGCCFLHCPDGYGMRPRDTGWFADIGALEDRQTTGQVPYATDGYRFWGATFDPSGLYRMRTVMGMLDQEGLTVSKIHNHVLRRQNTFLDRILNKKNLKTPIDSNIRGHFLTFEHEKAKELHETLKKHNIWTDFRGNRLRFGFSLYHDNSDSEKLAAELTRLAARLLPD